MKLRATSIFIIFFLSSTNIFCQTIEEEKSLNIGLVLSGGSAHGLAHIGVIKYLEEIGMPVDQISGTSMGSIVGGLLAMGYDSDQITHVASVQDWDAIFTNFSPLQHISPSEKKYHDKYPLTLERRDGQFHLPYGLIGGRDLDLTISRIYCPAHFIDDFMDLPIPFVCMATDLVEGVPVALKNGYLGRAIRTSMAIPSVFTPIINDQQLLVDGGVIRNLPVEECLSIGADVIIGVYVGSDKRTADKYNSLIDVLQYTASLQGRLDSDEQAKLCDVYIVPDVKYFDQMNFKDYQKLIDAGYEAAKAKKEELLGLLSKIGSKKRKKVTPLETPGFLYIKEVKFPNLPEPYLSVAKNACNIRDNYYYGIETIENGIKNIYGTKQFENVSYTFEHVEGIKVNLILEAKPVKLTKLYLTVNHFATTSTGLIANLEFRNKLKKNSVLNFTGRVSERPGASMDYRMRLGKSGHTILGFSGFTHNNKFKVFDQGLLRREYIQQNNGANLDWMYEFNNYTSLGIRLGVAHRLLTPRVTQDVDIEEYALFSFHQTLNFDFNSLDHIAFPSRGYNLAFRVQNVSKLQSDISYTSTEAENTLNAPLNTDYQWARLDLRAALPIHNSIIFEATAMGFHKTKSSIFDNAEIGATPEAIPRGFGFIGLQESELFLEEAIALRAKLRFEIKDNFFISLKGNLLRGLSGFDGFSRTRDGYHNYYGYGLELGIDSPIGPLTLDLGYGSTDSTIGQSISFGYRHIY